MKITKGLFKKGDIVLIAALLFICGIAFLFRYFNKNDGAYAVISCNGQTLYSIALSEIKEPYDIEAGSVVIAAEPGGVYFKSSDCPDKICVKTGRLSHINDTGVCLPNGIVITIKGGGKNPTDTPDVITY